MSRLTLFDLGGDPESLEDCEEEEISERFGAALAAKLWCDAVVSTPSESTLLATLEVRARQVCWVFVSTMRLAELATEDCLGGNTH
jgi:hypothetical protein